MKVKSIFDSDILVDQQGLRKRKSSGAIYGYCDWTMSGERNGSDGKGKTRDAEGVKRRVLASGKRLFAARGFAGTSLRQVAEASGVSTGLLNYHFRTKQALYDAVLQDALHHYIESQQPQLQMPDDVVEPFLVGAMRQYFRYTEAHPEWERLTAWSVLEKSAAKPSEVETQLLDLLIARIAAAKRAGVMREDLDDELLMIFVGSLMRSWLSYRERHAERLRYLGDERAQDEAYLELCAKIFQTLATDPDRPRETK